MAPALRSTLALLLLLALSAPRTKAHAMTGGASTTAFKCPECRMSTMGMGYNNEFYVELAHGQRVYTCGMAPRQLDDNDFESTDTAYVGANMAKYILAKSDKENYKCDDACPECAGGGLKDPMSGAAVTADNFKIVCLTNGQKIYFASDETRKQYLNKVGQAPRVAVASMICKKDKCSDAELIKNLSPDAKAFKPQAVIDSDSAPGPAPTPAASPAPSSGASTTNEESAGDSGFCSGVGSVMFNGFSSTINGQCVMLFFHPWVLNTAFKYVCGFLGCMLLSLGNECLVKLREWVRKQLLAARKTRPTDKKHKVACKLLLAFLYMVQMTVAYLAMLVVMTYETGLFIALILGFGAGFLLLKDFDVDVTNERGVWRYADPSVVRIRVEGMMCMKNCGTTVENALLRTDGVTNAFVDFDEKCAYVGGGASMPQLLEAIEAVGFTAHADQSGPDGGAFAPAQV
ncbi:hypothetical protein P43SY_005815 [Pythium insidiosum]|uniref:Copper transport protein n=1 Tax=Pythium insidiosum TaxID=114742 RepID=A0AAD5MCB8_PYTIN|nr:hypothetical protein P43SY_005815 [Pythium insidiosum]